MNHSVLKVISPSAETFFVGEAPLVSARLKLPMKGYLVGKNIIEDQNISIPVQALRVLGYQEQNFPHGLLVATRVLERLEEVFKTNVSQPEDDVDQEMLGQIEGLTDKDLVIRRIGKIRLKLEMITLERFEYLKSVATEAA
jgi:hypothetical protein